MELLVSLSRNSASWFADLSPEEQKRYVEQHPRTRFKVTKTKTATKSKTKTASASNLHDTQVVDGKRVLADGSPLPAHIVKLSIPPKWTALKINPDPNADLLATGRDAKGRLQSVYSEKFANSQAEKKFLRVQALAQEFDGINAQNEKARKSKDVRKRAAADCMKLIMTMGIRPGSDNNTQADVKAYGATNLRKEHVVTEKGKTFLRFTGKKGVALDLEVHDPSVARMLKQRAATGDSESLFPEINEDRLREYSSTLDGGNFRPKDFRTHLGTKTALEEMSKVAKPKNEKEYRKAVMAVAKTVSDRLGNTPTVALQSYINPTVFASWRTR